jgi:uncharacterized protein YneF (UPF0154 family)
MSDFIIGILLAFIVGYYIAQWIINKFNYEE